jgi:hypothetical protein
MDAEAISPQLLGRLKNMHEEPYSPGLETTGKISLSGF